MKITLTGIFNDGDKYRVDTNEITGIYENSIWRGYENTETKKFNIEKHDQGCTIVEYKKLQDNGKDKYFYLRVKETEKEIKEMYES